MSKDYSWCSELYDCRIFLVSKVLWEHNSIQFSLHTIFFFSYRFGHIWPFRSTKKNRYDQRPFDMIRSDWKILIFVKRLMGRNLDSIFFTHIFFFRYLLGPREVSKYKFASVSSKIFLYDSIWLVFFLCQKLYGNTSLFRQIY